MPFYFVFSEKGKRRKEKEPLTPGSMYGGYTGSEGTTSVTLDSDERIV